MLSNEAGIKIYSGTRYSTGWAKQISQLVLSELSQIFTKFDNFWHTDGLDDRIM